MYLYLLLICILSFISGFILGVHYTSKYYKNKIFAAIKQLKKLKQKLEETKEKIQ